MRGEGGGFPIQGQQERVCRVERRERAQEREEEEGTAANRIEGKEIKKEREANDWLTSGEGIWPWSSHDSKHTERERESGVEQGLHQVAV